MIPPSRGALRRAALAIAPIALTLFNACSDAPTIARLAAPVPARALTAADTVPDIDDGLTVAAAANGSQIIEAQLELRRMYRLDDLVAMADRFGLQIVGVNHGFRDGTDVQLGGYDIPDGVPATTWAAEYSRSTGEFLRTSVELATRAAAEEADQALRRGYERLGRTFRARLAHHESGGASIYSVRVRGRADVIAGLWRLDRGVRTAAIRLPGHQYRRPRYPNDLRGHSTAQKDGTGTVSPTMVVCIDPTVDCGPYVPPEPAPEPAPIEVTVPLYSMVLTGAFVPPPEADPWNDDGYYDDNSVSNFQWAPSHGKSWLDRDAVSKYSYQYISWRFPGLSGIQNSCGYVPGECGFSIEHEVHQDGNWPRTIYGKGFYQNFSGRNRGAIWESSMPLAYLDSQFGDGLFAGKSGVQNTAIGTNAPQQLQYNTVYYNWIRFDQYAASSGTGPVQVAVQLGDKLNKCTSTAWCTLKSLATVRVIPFRCNYRAPNSLYVTTSDKWLSWYYDGRGYKNEGCAATG